LTVPSHKVKINNKYKRKGVKNMGKTIFGVNKEKLESTMERVFDAPRNLLWKAHTEKDLMAKWWGPRAYEVIVEEYDARNGGTWRISHKGKDEKGEEVTYAFYGDIIDVKEQEHITWTFNFEPIGPGHEITETVTFEDLGNGKTKLSTVSHYKTIEDLEGMLQSGMEDGANETWDRLEELAQSQK
jgi:uncharacterized protein YndB with AHSA1/START domain